MFYQISLNYSALIYLGRQSHNRIIQTRYFLLSKKKNFENIRSAAENATWWDVYEDDKEIKWSYTKQFSNFKRHYMIKDTKRCATRALDKLFVVIKSYEKESSSINEIIRYSIKNHGVFFDYIYDDKNRLFDGMKYIHVDTFNIHAYVCVYTCQLFGSRVLKRFIKITTFGKKLIYENRVSHDSLQNYHRYVENKLYEI